MHEVSLMQSAVDQAFAAANQGGAARIYGIRLKIGAWSGVVPEALQLAFDVVTLGTIAEGATLEVDTISPKCRCATCPLEFEPMDSLAVCPQCGGSRLQMLAGQELELASIEVSDT